MPTPVIDLPVSVGEIPRFSRPIAAAIKETDPDIVIGLDPNARLVGYAVSLQQDSAIHYMPVSAKGISFRNMCLAAGQLSLPITDATRRVFLFEDITSDADSLLTARSVLEAAYPALGRKDVTFRYGTLIDMPHVEKVGCISLSAVGATLDIVDHQVRENPRLPEIIAQSWRGRPEVLGIEYAPSSAIGTEIITPESEAARRTIREALGAGQLATFPAPA